MRHLAVMALVLSWAGAANAQTPHEQLEERGCLGCHSVDGSAAVGPTFAGLHERIGAAGVAAALRDPVPPMPNYGMSDADISAMTEALRLVEPEAAGWTSIWPLALSCGLFVLLHLLLSAGPVRRRLVGRLGESGFMGAYSAAVGGAFVGIFVGWYFRPFIPLWDASATWMRHLPLTLVPLGLFFIVAGYTTPSPTAVMQDEAAERAPVGVMTITRHPALWGFLLWGLAHIPANGDLAALLLFGSFVALSVLGMLHIDARRRAAAPARWESFAEQTSLVPFGAIVRGQTRLDTSGLLVRMLGALVIAALYAFGLHELIFGVPALPYEWAY